jgi:hypothetical protein
MLHSLRTTGRNALSTRQVYAHILETIVAKANELEQDGYEVLRIYGGTGVPNNMESTLGTLGFYLQKTTDFTIQYKRSKASKKKGVIRYAFRTKATTNAHKNDSWVDTFTSTHDVMSVVRDDNIHTLTELLSFKSKIKPRYGFTRVVIFYRE